MARMNRSEVNQAAAAYEANGRAPRAVAPQDEEQNLKDQQQELIEKYPEYMGLKAVELARIMKECGAELDDLKEKVKEQNQRYDFLRIIALPQAMEAEGLENFKVEGLGRVSLTSDMWIHVPKVQKPAFFQWLREHEHGDIIQPSVNASTVKAMVKQLLVTGKELPPGDVLKITPYTRASITKA